MGEVELGHVDALPVGFRRDHPQRLWRVTRLFLIFLAGVMLLASCGNDDEEEGPTTQEIPAPPTIAASPAPTQDPSVSTTEFLPCHTDLEALQKIVPVADPTPEVVRIQLLERPWRMIPSDIVLRQNRWYEFVITAGEEWHSFVVHGMGTRVDYEIPPGGEKAPWVHTTNAGVFVVENWRRIQESELRFTITVVPEAMTASTWQPSCATLSVHAPSVGSQLSTPLVIQGSAKQPSGSWLDVTRIEAWSNGERVGLTTRDHFVSRGTHSDYYLTIPHLPPGAHSLLLKAFLQNGTLAATATMPITILPDPPTSATTLGYRGHIDHLTENELLGLPVTIQGWAIIHNSKGTGVSAVEIWNGPRENGQFLTEAIYGIHRPDVAQVLGDQRFASSGFIAQLPDLPAGPIDLRIYVRSRESGDYVSPQQDQPPLARRVTLAEGKVTHAAWPVALAAAPDGRLFFAELLTGNIRIIQNGNVLPKPFATIEDVSNHRESGFLGLALHPDFPREPFVFAMYVVDDPETGLPSGQRVVRFRDVDNTGQDYTVIVEGLPATTNVFHNGGRIAFGADGKLFLSIGDTDVPDLAEDPAKLEGSILRYNPDGSIPDDNPIPGSPVYAIGLRNVFGLAIQPGTGFLYATDNGPGGFDEVNRIESGHNYGWPRHMGVRHAEGITDPIAVYGNWPERPIGPSGAAFAATDPDLLLFCAYHDFYLRALPLSGPDQGSQDDTMVLSTNCALDVTYSSDGWLYYSTVSAIYRARLDDLLLLHENNDQQE